MEYSALVFDDCKEVEDTYNKLLETIDLFANDENCCELQECMDIKTGFIP